MVHAFPLRQSTNTMINGRIVGAELREVPPERVSHVLSLALLWLNFMSSYLYGVSGGPTLVVLLVQAKGTSTSSV